MTTILADAKLGVMASDSVVSDGTTVSTMRKVWRVRGALIGLAGDVTGFEPFLAWYKSGMTDTPFGINSVYALVLSKSGLIHFSGRFPTPSQKGIEAIGTGAMAALAVHEALNFVDPTKAVRIVCKHDASSRGPVRTYKL